MSENIAKILYINLEHRTDKKELMEKELENMNWLEKTTRFPGVYHEKTYYGCSMAHLNALKYAKSQQFANVLIFEDDFEFLESKETVESHVTEFFRTHTNADFDVLFFSYFVEEGQDTSFDFLGKAISARTTSGYLVSSHYYDTLIDLFESNFPKLLETGMHWVYTIDQIWKQLQKNDRWFYFKPRLGKQRVSLNDNGGVMVDYGF